MYVYIDFKNEFKVRGWVLKLKGTKGPLHADGEVQLANSRPITRVLLMERVSPRTGRSAFSCIKIRLHHSQMVGGGNGQN